MGITTPENLDYDDYFAVRVKPEDKDKYFLIRIDTKLRLEQRRIKAANEDIQRRMR